MNKNFWCADPAAAAAALRDAAHFVRVLATPPDRCRQQRRLRGLSRSVGYLKRQQGGV